MATCETCHGEGAVTVSAVCEKCQGTGEITVYEDEGDERFEICPLCEFGTLFSEEVCPTCRGRGEVWPFKSNPV